MMENHWNWYPIFGQTQVEVVDLDMSQWFWHSSSFRQTHWAKPSQLLLFPLERLKTLLQVDPEAYHGSEPQDQLISAAVEKDGVLDNFQTIRATLCHCPVILWCWGSLHLYNGKTTAKMHSDASGTSLSIHMSCDIMWDWPSTKRPGGFWMFCGGCFEMKVPQVSTRVSSPVSFHQWFAAVIIASLCSSKVAHQCFKRWAHPTFCTSFSSRVLRSQGICSEIPKVQLGPTWSVWPLGVDIYGTFASVTRIL